MREGSGPAQPGGVLAPTPPLGASKDDSKFRVVFAGPEGKAADASEITVVFSRPLRPLDREVPPPSIRMTPVLPGHFIWVGSRAVRFVPDGPATLPGATRVELEVSEATRALDGTPLGAAHRFGFETPRPTLAGSSPTGDGHVPQAQVELSFNQTIEPAELEKHLVLEAERGGKRRKLAFRVDRPDQREPKRLRVVPKAPLPLDSTVVGTLSSALHSTAGPLPAGSEQSFTFTTYGPLRVRQATCWAEHGEVCGFGSAPYFEFSNEVSWAKLKRAVSVTPPVALKWESWQDDAGFTRDFVIPARFEPGRSYTIRIAGDLGDRFAQKIVAPFAQTFRFSDVPASVEIGVRGDNIAAGGSTRIPIGAVNLPGYDLLTASLLPSEALAFEESGEMGKGYDVLSRAGGVRRERVTAGGPKNRIVRREVDLATLLPGGLGVAGIGVGSATHDGQRHSVRLVKTSDLAVTAKLGIEGSLVWVTRLSSATSVKGADVELWRQGEPMHRYRTDENGLVRVPASDLSLENDGYVFEKNALVVARSGTDWTYEALSHALAPWSLPVPSDLSKQDRTYGMIFTDRGVYRPGDAVRVKGIVRRETRSGNAVVAGERFEIALAAPDGSVLERRNVTTTPFGTFALDTRVPASGGLGSYALSTAGQAIQSAFQVSEYRPAEFSVNVTAGAAEYRRGESARFETRGDYLFGAPMSGASVRYTLTRAPGAFQVPGHDGFSVSAEAFRADLEERSLSSGVIAQGEGKLDATG
ncbi:MAG TPA: MG2 domain-containing protein, partial [Polyangiaceae bacterium]|nr:MG2 domain-containing protein [Polyangiaceae bacterium]